MGLSSDYFAYQRHFEQKYGPNTVVFIQKGTFYEIYEYDPQSDLEQTVLENITGNAAIYLRVRDNKITSMNEVDNSLQIMVKPFQIPVNGPGSEQLPVGKARELSLKLGLKLTSSDKGKPHSLENPYMVGIPVANYEERREVLLAHGYTIIRIDETGDDAGKRSKKREIVEITSPGTELDKAITIQPTGSDTLVCIYIEYQRLASSGDNIQVVCGLSSIDISTGQNVVAETYSKPQDEVYAIQEIYRFLTSQKPVEILLCLNKMPPEKAEGYLNYLENQLDLNKYCLVITSVNQIKPEFFELDYQETFLRKAFSSTQPIVQQVVDESVSEPKVLIHQAGTTGPASMIEDLDLERLTYGRVSYLYLLQHCNEHRDGLIQRIQKPGINWTDAKTSLILTHNAVDQLDIFPQRTDIFSKHRGIIDSLVSVIDMTVTEMGSRYLRRRLLNPIRDVDQLERYYQMTQELMDRPALVNTLRMAIRGLPDLEKLHRKIQLKVITPRELSVLIRGYYRVYDVYLKLYSACFDQDDPCEALQSLLMSDQATQDFNESYTQLLEEIDLDKLDRVKYTSRGGGRNVIMQCEESFIREGRDQVIDDLSNQLGSYREWSRMICDHLNELLKGTRCKKVEISQTRKGKKSDDDEAGPTNLDINIVTSAASVKHLCNVNIGSMINRELCGYLEFHKINTAETSIKSERIDACINSIIILQTNLETEMLRRYRELISELSEHDYFIHLNRLICELDFVLSNVQSATKYRYFRPTLDRSVDKAYIKAKNLRHPLIERIIRTEYIPNDLELGKDYYGILQYGVNSSGKTSLAKSVGIALIMAQAGMFVAGEITYYPYAKIITRLSGHDNLFKGQSSFVVEMMELKTILRNADADTFVLGDELCRGTESISGHGLTVSTIETLIERGASFIFSTHMHGLVQLKAIQDKIAQKRLRVCHLSTHYSTGLGRLVYDRVLRDGSGSSLYGLEVCRSLNLPKEFITRAQEISRGLTGDWSEQFVSEKKSRYNSSIRVEKCSLCDSRLDLQTHHLEEQSKADSAGFIDHYHKNANFNLLVICGKCHRDLHQRGVEFQPRQTLEGVFLGEPSPEPKSPLSEIVVYPQDVLSNELPSVNASYS